MFKEEAFHLFTGHTGLGASSKPAKCHPDLQKYLNKWLSTGYDLFGKYRSSSAARFYRWHFQGPVRRMSRRSRQKISTA